ncbi:hypothetical protein L484_027442 [Morus notabilis]|uniref:Uncharacterized protein n=1 Tax=Morus notabilis TaxID=981085 RepID=W9S632_9ROSA|nr:hypothetical protein L484_027442 [Morus notabilis]
MAFDTKYCLAMTCLAALSKDTHDYFLGTRQTALQQDFTAEKPKISINAIFFTTQAKFSLLFIFRTVANSNRSSSHFHESSSPSFFLSIGRLSYLFRYMVFGGPARVAI